MSLGPYKRHELLAGRNRISSHGYRCYGDGSSTKRGGLHRYEMRRLGPQREELIAFWESGQSPTIFPTVCHGFTRIGLQAVLPWARGIWT